MTTFLLRLDPPPGDGPTVAVKDLIDIAGTPTTCASQPVAVRATAVTEDAACVAAIRAAGGRIVGKTNLHELAFGGSGVNPYTGTPVNPLDPARIPGGSSSGSAVAVAMGVADIALGTDTGGSIRTPSACCGTVGLKTTFGRLPLDGIHPLAPSMDTVGPMAATVAGVAVGMALLEPGFMPASGPAPVLGRFHLPGTDPAMEAAIDHLLHSSEVEVEACELPSWLEADEAGTTIVFAEAAAVNGALLRDHADQLGPETLDRLTQGTAIAAEQVATARRTGDRWRAELDAALVRTPVIALAGIVGDVPPLDDPLRIATRRPNVAVNLAGNPAIVLPVPRPGSPIPWSIQLIAAHGREDLLVATAAHLEAAGG